MSLNSPQYEQLNANGLRFAVIAAKFNQTLVDALLETTVATLRSAGASGIEVERVPGSAELPTAAALLGAALRPDAIIVLGVVIAGDTDHHRVIGDSAAQALNRVSLDLHIPVINGILVTNTQEQAEARASGPINRGAEFARAAIEMGNLKTKWTKNRQ